MPRRIDARVRENDKLNFEPPSGPYTDLLMTRSWSISVREVSTPGPGTRDVGRPRYLREVSNGRTILDSEAP